MHSFFFYTVLYAFTVVFSYKFTVWFVAFWSELLLHSQGMMRGWEKRRIIGGGLWARDKCDGWVG